MSGVCAGNSEESEDHQNKLNLNYEELLADSALGAINVEVCTKAK